MAIRRLTDDEVGSIRVHAQNLLSLLCCPESTAQCPRCQTIRGAYFMAVELQDIRRAGKGIQIATVIDHGYDATALQARALVPNRVLEEPKKEPALEDATQEMPTVPQE